MRKDKKSKKGRMGDRTRERANERKGAGGSNYLNLPEGVEFFKPEKKCRIDIVPYVVSDKHHPEQIEAGEPWWRRLIYIHPQIGVEQRTFLCPKTIGKPCPICDEYKKMKKDPDADEDMVKALRPKEREIFNVIDLDNDPEKVLLWEISTFLFGQLLEEEVRESEDETVGDFAEVKGGKTLTCRFKKDSFNNNPFLKISKIDFEDREDYEKSILEETLDLDSILNVLSYKDLQEKFLGSEDASDDEEEDEKPKEKKKKNECIACEGEGINSKGKTCKICEGTGEASLDDDDDDDDEPKKKKKPDDDDDDDDDEEEKPKKKNSSRRK